mmetsp:Transcript_20012/g.28149  ORF Transcript_20012/g.28149 Transcript_20012/m.28149 type:complete len:368 (+) Transcript_20012:36-1139(+)
MNSCDGDREAVVSSSSSSSSSKDDKAPLVNQFEWMRCMELGYMDGPDSNNDMAPPICFQCGNSSSNSSSSSNNNNNNNKDNVGYIRLTRFSRSSTAGYIQAIHELEKAGAQSYIIDVRNNYGGVIQEAMLTASTLLRNPHSVLCYTLNSRGGFTPHDVEEYVVDARYPGYFLSRDPQSVTLEQAKREDPDYFKENGWYPPSSYASLREQRLKRGIMPPISTYSTTSSSPSSSSSPNKNLESRKKVVILINEGTASSAEVFVSSLRDNGRTVALVGTQTYGKGLIQHTIPMPDGGGLRLTVAEYLTPSLKHVTKVGDAKYDPSSGRIVGGGVRPDIFCPSTQGIPSNIGADICVGIALDALDDDDGIF